MMIRGWRGFMFVEKVMSSGPVDILTTTPMHAPCPMPHADSILVTGMWLASGWW